MMDTNISEVIRRGKIVLTGFTNIVLIAGIVVILLVSIRDEVDIAPVANPMGLRFFLVPSK